MRKSLVAASIATAVVGAAALAAPASAAPPTVGFGKPTTVASGLVTPLSMDVDGTGVGYVAQSFAGLLTRVTPGGKITNVVTAPGSEIGAVATRGGSVYFAESQFGPEGSYASNTMQVLSSGTKTQLADLQKYEIDHNPDGGVTYGFVDLPEECAAQFPPESPATYTGIVESHPYGAAAGSDALYVADAAGNDIVRVGYDGALSTVAVLPPSVVENVPAEVVANAGYPACAVGYDYRFEPVPTDVEIGPGGQLYVSTLPGGPEDPSLGARGEVFRVDPAGGAVTRLAGGFGGATNLAVSPNTGVVFVAELFGGPQGTGRVSAVLPGGTKAAASVAVTGPAAVELRGGKLYVSRNALSEGPDGVVTAVPLLPTFSW